MKKSIPVRVIVPAAAVCATLWIACPESQREALAMTHEHTPQPQDDHQPFDFYGGAQSIVSSTSAGFASGWLYRLDLKAHRRMMLRHLIAPPLRRHR